MSFTVQCICSITNNVLRHILLISVCHDTCERQETLAFSHSTDNFSWLSSSMHLIYFSLHMWKLVCAKAM